MSRARLGFAMAIAIVVAIGALTAGAIGAGVSLPGGGTRTAAPMQESAARLISSDQAIDVAAGRVGATGELRSSARATLSDGVWEVMFFVSAGPTSGYGYVVTIDAETGKVLDVSQLFS